MSAKSRKPTFHSGKTFGQLTSAEKFRFVGKAFIFFASGGFVYPTMWVD